VIAKILNCRSNYFERKTTATTQGEEVIKMAEKKQNCGCGCIGQKKKNSKAKAEEKKPKKSK
jgi:hypothetical protein